MKTLFIRVFGDVQGVGYRYYTQTIAKQLSLRGWVRNEYNDTVTIEVTGTEAQLATFLDYVKEGPRFARVTEVVVEEREATCDHPLFYIKH